MAFYSALDAEEAEKTERFPQIFKCVAIKKLYLFIKKKKKDTVTPFISPF